MLIQFAKKRQLFVRFYIPRAVVECLHSWSSLTWKYHVREKLQKRFKHSQIWWENWKINDLVNWLSSWIWIQITLSIQFRARVSVFRYLSFKAFENLFSYLLKGIPQKNISRFKLSHLKSSKLCIHLLMQHFCQIAFQK